MEAILSRISKTDSCWNWTGEISGQGYGRYRKKMAHRVVYEALVGPIPEGLCIDHLCRNTRCVNPKHLEPVTSRENTLRGIGPSANHARRTHCNYGHPLSGDNLYIKVCKRDKPNRRCRACHSAWCWQARQKRKLLKQPIPTPYKVQEGLFS